MPSYKKENLIKKEDDMNTPINFELAKLLKEKGYRILPDFKSSYPTISDVVMWLYEKHDIDVSAYGKLPYIVFPDSEYGEGELQWHFEYRVIQNIDGQKCKVIEPKTWYDTKTEAYEAAIEYALKNLI